MPKKKRLLASFFVLPVQGVVVPGIAPLSKANITPWLDFTNGEVLFKAYKGK